MRIDLREARIAFSSFCYALVATMVLVALFSALLLARENKTMDCSWKNQSGGSSSQTTGVDWHCANGNYIVTGK
jgi:hypothetical protein